MAGSTFNSAVADGWVRIDDKIIQIKHAKTVILDRKNYFTWHAQFLAMLCGYELVDYIKLLDILRPSKTPMDTSINLVPPSDSCPDDKDYRSLIGSLQYLMLMWPDITFVAAKAAHFMASPKLAHWNAVRRIFHYLAGTQAYGIWLAKMTIKGWSDFVMPTGPVNSWIEEVKQDTLYISVDHWYLGHRKNREQSPVPAQRQSIVALQPQCRSLNGWNH